MNLTVPMALADYVPVVLFLIAIVFLQRDLYYKFSKGAFSLFAGGGFMVFAGGFYKATWKLLMGAGICNFEKLNQSFFPMQATGFLLAGIAMIALLCFPQKKNAVYAAAPAVYSGTILFVAAMVFGVGAMCISLAVIAFKMKKKLAGVIYLLSFVFMLGMGYLSSKDFSSAGMNWIAQLVNATGQGLFLIGTLMLHKAKLAEFELKK